MLIWQKRKGTQGLIEIENPNLAKQKNVKAKDVDVSYNIPLLHKFCINHEKIYEFITVLSN